MHRRRVLALVGSLATTAGCTGTGDGPSVDSTVTPIPVPTGDTTTAHTRQSAGNVEITEAGVLPGVVTTGDDSISVRDDAGQYLFLDLDGTVPDPSTVEFRFSGASYTPESFSGQLYRGDFDGEEYDESGGALVFGLPETGDATDAELALESGEWTPPSTTVQRLEDPLPPFSVTLDGPETAAEISDRQLTVSVTNEGDGAGRYVLALNRQEPGVASTPVTRIEGELESGATETHFVDAVAPEGDRSTRYTLDVPDRRTDISHTITPAE